MSSDTLIRILITVWVCVGVGICVWGTAEGIIEYVDERRRLRAARGER